MKARISLVKKDVKAYGGGILLLILYILVVGEILKIPICPMVYLTGYPCPACGMTRAALLFLHGDFLGAWEMHPLFYVLLAWLLLFVIFRYILCRDIQWMKYLGVIVTIVAIVYYIYRMYRYFPEKEPMIYNCNSFLGKIRSCKIFENMLK